MIGDGGNNIGLEASAKHFLQLGQHFSLVVTGSFVWSLALWQRSPLVAVGRHVLHCKLIRLRPYLYLAYLFHCGRAIDSLIVSPRYETRDKYAVF